MEYEDFAIKIARKRTDDTGETYYPVFVLSSPAGEGNSQMYLPFDLEDVGDVLFPMSQDVRRSSAPVQRSVASGATSTPPRQFGSMLFDALFSGTVRSLFDRSQGMLHGRRKGLRIKLHIDPEDLDLARLAGLPWEFIFQKETREFLNLSKSTPILRYLDVQRPSLALDFTPPLRILVVIASPSGYDTLNVSKERMLIEKGWGNNPEVEVEFFEHASVQNIMDKLREADYHVLHYIGHGDFDERAGKGVLLLEDEDGGPRPFEGGEIANLLRDQFSLRLVFLNACNTARVTEERGHDPFAGVASAMVMAGMPAVVAMQFPISDTAAIKFSEQFYKRLAAGDPVDTAVSEGRRSVRFSQSGSMEWGTPVLFIRAPNGELFTVVHRRRTEMPADTRHDSAPVDAQPDDDSRDSLTMADQQAAEAPHPTVEDDMQAKLWAFWRSGVTAYYSREWQDARQALQAIVDIDPDYMDAAAKLVRANREALLADLYARAQSAMDDERWSEAVSFLEELRGVDDSDENIAELLERANRRLRLEALHDEAHIVFEAEQWQGVIAVFDEISSLSNDFADPDNLLEKAQARLVAQKQRQQIEQLLFQAFERMEAADWQAADELVSGILTIDPEHSEAAQLDKRVKEELAKDASQDDPFPYEETVQADAGRDQPDQGAFILRRFESAGVLEYHRGKVRTVNFSPDGCSLATGSNDKRVYIWNVADDQILMTLWEFVKQVNSVAFSASDPHALVTGSGGWWGPGKEPRRLQLWNLDSDNAQSVLSCESVQDSIVSVSISSDSGFIAGVDQQHNVYLWNSTDGSRVEDFDPHYALSQLNEFSSLDEIVEEEAVEEIDDAGSIPVEDFDPDHTLSQSDDIPSLEEIEDDGSVLVRMAISVYSFAFTSAGNQAIITGSGKGRDFCCLYQIDENAPVRYWISNEVSAPEPNPLLNDTSSRIIVVSNDASLLAYRHIDATAIQILRLWDGSTVSECVREVPIPYNLQLTSCALFSPDNSLLAVGYTDGLIRIWDVAEGALHQILEGHSKCIMDLAFSPDGSLLASASADSTARAWRAV